MDILKREADERFEHLIYFEKEISNPRIMKGEIDKLVHILNKSRVGHKNRVITKVVRRDPIKKTVTMLVHMEVEDPSLVQSLLEQYPQYGYREQFFIAKGFLISISNNMQEFKQAVELFMAEIKQQPGDVNQYDVSNNSIIEVSRIGYDGTILGFDLYLEYEGLEMNYRAVSQ